MKTTSEIMKILLLISVIILNFSITRVFACEIEFEVQGEKKEIYSIGDTVIVKIKVWFTHRVCEITIKDTQFEHTGFKIAGATDWKEIYAGIWERKLQLIVTGTEKGKLSLSATRTCSKEGGFGSLTLEGEPLKE